MPQNVDVSTITAEVRLIETLLRLSKNPENLQDCSTIAVSLMYLGHLHDDFSYTDLNEYFLLLLDIKENRTIDYSSKNAEEFLKSIRKDLTRIKKSINYEGQEKSNKDKI